MLEHGGRLRRAAQQYAIPRVDWVDLSTGINPFACPLPAVPAEAWQRLPEDDDGLAEAAAAFYGSPLLLPVAGSQAAIQALPACFPAGRVVTLAPTYAEHPHAWRDHQLVALPAGEIDAAVADADTVLLVQPNNPDGQRFPQKQGIECCFPCLYFSRSRIVRHSLEQIPYLTRKQSAETIDRLHVYPVSRLVVEQGNRVAV